MKVDYAEILSDPGMFEAFKRSSYQERNEVLSHVYETLKKCLIERKVFNEKLHASLFIGLCEAFGGQQIYVPKGRHLFKILDVKYKIGTKTIDIIVARQRKFQKMARDSLEGIGIRHD